MLKAHPTVNDTKLKFVITGDYSSFLDFLDAACEVIEQIRDAKEEYFDGDIFEPVGTVYPVEEPHTVTILI